MEGMLATEHQDKGLARRSLDLSCLDDIPEERVLSGKSSEEKEITRLDSGLGEWDSESSRKTSFSSQGRLSPDFAMSKDCKETNGKNNEVNGCAKRRRSGVDMVHSDGGTDMELGKIPVVKTRLPRIPRSNRASGIWGRKISPAGIQYLKMEDEMEEIIRNGKPVMVPRKISDHIPTVPIHSVDRFLLWEWNENLGLEDEDLQIYKTPVCDIYELHRHRWEFFGKMDFRKMMLLSLDGNAWMNGQQKLEMMMGLVSEKDQKKMQKMLDMGYSADEVVNHFMEDAEKKGGNMGLTRKLMSLMNEDLTDDQAIELMREELGEKSQKKMEELIKQGYSAKEVMQKMMAEGQTKEEELKETAETMKHLLATKKKNIKTSQKDVQAMLEERLDDESKEKMKEMLAQGIPLQEVLDTFVKQFEEEEELTGMEKKVQDAKDAAAAAGKELSQYQIFELMKSQMDAESRNKMDEMLKSGCPLDEVIEHFMKKGKTKEESQNEKSEQMRQLIEENKDMTPEQIMEMLRSELGADDKKQMDKMLKSGCSMQEVIDHFVNRGYESDSDEKTEFQLKMEEMLDGKHLNEDEILALMRSQVDDETKAEIKAMLEKGYTKQDVINHLMKTIKTDDEKDREATRKLIALFDDQNMGEEEKIALLEKQLNDEDKAQMQEMLKLGCTIEEVIGHFMSRSQSPDKEKSNFAKKIDQLIEGKNLTVDQVLDVIAEQLDEEQRQKMEDMLNKGYTKQDVVNHFLRTAKTKEEQMQETADKIKALMSDESMSDSSKLEMLRNQLSKEDLAQMEEMLRDGGSLEDVMQQILKSKSTESLAESDLSSIVHKAMAEGKMSNEMVLDLIKSQLDEHDQKEMALMLEKGMTEQEVIDHYLNHGKTALEKQREISEQLQTVLSDITNPSEKLDAMRGVLSDKDKAQMEQMLKQGCSMEEVIAHFSNRGMEPSGIVGNSDLAVAVKKLSGGKSLTPDQMLSLISEQLSEEGQKAMEEMLAKGYSKEDVIQHFLTKGKTKLEEQREISEQLQAMLGDITNPSEKLDAMRGLLSDKDKAQMEQMLKQGCSMEEVIEHFSNRGMEPSGMVGDSDLAVAVRKISEGKNLTSDQLLSLIGEQLSEEGKKSMQDMLNKGYSKEDVIQHFLTKGKTKQEEQREISEHLQAVLGGISNPKEKLDAMRSVLSDKDRAQMEQMLKQGCSMEEVIEHFSNRGMEPSGMVGDSDLAVAVRKLSDGKTLTPDQMLSIISEQLSEEGQKAMEEMLSKGYSKEDVIQHFLTKGKTKLEEQREISEHLQAMLGDITNPNEKLDAMRGVLSDKDKAQMEQMLMQGCSMEEVIAHFSNRGMEPSGIVGDSDLAVAVRKISEGKNLTPDQMLSIISEQLSEEGKKIIEEMLAKGYSKEDVIQHLLTKGKTKQEEQREMSEHLQAMLSNISSPSAKLDAMRGVMSDKDNAEMEQMLKQGCSMEEVIAHFSNRGMESTETENTSDLAKAVKRLSKGKNLSSDQMLSLISEQLSDEGQQIMKEMLAKGHSKEDVIQHFLTKGKTKLEEHKETAKRLSVLIDPDTMSEDQIAEVMQEQLSPSQKKLMEQMLKDGKSMKEIVKHFIELKDIEPAETALAIKIKKLSGGRKLSNEEMVELLAGQLGETGRREMEDMLAGGASMEEVIQHFMEHGQTQEEEEREVANKLCSLMSDSMTEEDIKGLLQSELNSTDRKKMDEMLMSGYSIEEILEHFQTRGMEKSDETALAATVRKISKGRKLSNQQMLEIIKDQLGEEGKASMEEMLKTGMSEEEVIAHFMTKGKTVDEEHRETGLKLAELSKGRKLSSEQKLELMSAQLGKADKAQMEQMLRNGCSIEEVFELFTTRGASPVGPRSELANRVRKHSKGRILPKNVILDLIKMQISEESKIQIQKMLEKGYTESDVIEHFLINGKTSDEEHREVASRLEKLIDMKSMSDEKMLNIMNNVLGEFDKAQMSEMQRRGCTTPEIVKLFLNRGKNPGKKTEFAARMERLLGGELLPPQEILEIMRDNLDDESKKVIDQLLEKGYTVQDVIEHMIKNGKTPEEKQKEVAEKMLTLLDGDMSEEQVIAMMRKQLGQAGCKELEDMLKRGCSLNEIIDNFIHKPSELVPVEEDTEFAKKIKQMMGDKTLSAEEMMNLIKSALDPVGQSQLEEMLRCGCSHDEVIQHFMNRERNKKGQKRNEFGRKIYELTKGKKLTKKELIMLMKNNLDQDSLAKMEEMLKKGYPIEDVIDYFLKNGKTPQQALREKTVQKEKEKKEAAKKLKEKIEGNNLSNEEILAILQLSMGDEDRAQLDLMIKKGCSNQEIIEHFMNRDVSDEETEKTLFQKKINELIGDKELDQDQVLDLMMNELDDESVIQMNKMLEKGYTKDDVIKYFMKHGDDRNDFVNEMKKLAGDKDMSKDEILDMMKSKLGVMSQRKMEDMLREGYSAEEIIQHLMTHGKTQEQETKLFTRRMSIMLEKEATLSDKEKVDRIKEHLGKEAASMLEELLKNGFTHAGLLDLFLRHGNDVNSLVADDFFIRDIRFPDEPLDAESHKNRDVFSVINKDEIKSRISYMSPSGKMHIFGLFFEMVLEVVSGKGLTHREILDLMRSRMGAGYAKEFDDLRKKGFSLQQIVDYFLRRDEETISESRLVAKLKAEARVDSRVYLKREYSKEKWGVSLTYTYSKNHGLHLIMDDVVENGPAWESGVRAGDVIVTVNDWLIVLMDRPQVAAHLFQAGANIVKLGIQKTRGTSPDKYLGVY